MPQAALGLSAHQWDATSGLLASTRWNAVWRPAISPALREFVWGGCRAPLLELEAILGVQLLAHWGGPT